jgi:DNA-binding NtrC family response regulator
MPVLIVEDEPAVREMLAKALRTKGHEVLTAHDGAEALAVVEKSQVDLVVTDLWMPVMSGVELIEALTSLDHPAEVIVLSAHITNASTDALRALGVIRTLNKPVDLGALFEAVANGLASDRKRRVLEARAARRRMAAQAYASKGPAVLIADDDPVVRSLLREALTRSGYLVEEAADGEEALEKALAEDVGLVLMDINMPRMGGLDAITAIRKACPECFAICMTGEVGSAEVDACMKAGAVSFFRKPFDMKRLMAEVGRLDLIAAHRRKLARWEAGAREADAKSRSGALPGTRRRLKWLLVAGVAAAALAAAAVPAVTAWMRSAASATASAAGRVNEALDSANRIEGYLQRDEERELRGR